MEELDPINFDEASKYDIMENILYISEIFEVGELYCQNMDFIPNSVSIITANKMWSAIFDDSQIKGGHARMGDIMLDILDIDAEYKSNRKTGKFPDFCSVFLENNKDKIFVLTSWNSVIVTMNMNDKNEITQTQFNYLNKCMSDLKDERVKKVLEKNAATLHLYGNDYSFSPDSNEKKFTEEKLNEKMEEIYSKVKKDKDEVSMEDFSRCESNKGIKAKFKEYISKLKKFKKSKNKEDFLKGKTLNTELEEEARSVVDADVKETLIEQVSEELIDEKQ